MPDHGSGVRNSKTGTGLEGVPSSGKVTKGPNNSGGAPPKAGPKGHPVTGKATPSSPQAAAKQGEEMAKRPRS